MASTDTQTETVSDVLDSGDLNRIPQALRLLDLPEAMTLVDETITLAALAATIDLTTKSASGRPALSIVSCRVTSVGAGTADLGQRLITDASGTPAAKGANIAGIATLSANGHTLTFEGTLLAIRLLWAPRPDFDQAADTF